MICVRSTLPTRSTPPLPREAIIRVSEWEIGDVWKLTMLCMCVFTLLFSTPDERKYDYNNNPFFHIRAKHFLEKKIKLQCLLVLLAPTHFRYNLKMKYGVGEGE